MIFLATALAMAALLTSTSFRHRFKTATGFWNYPEPSLLRLGHVPLFTGFMYGAIGSYLVSVWRLFDFRFRHHPGTGALVVLSVAIYANVFSDHWGLDGRYGLVAVTVLPFRRTVIRYRVWRLRRQHHELARSAT